MATTTTPSPRTSTSPHGTTTSARDTSIRCSNGATHDLTRGFKGKNFWVMETQPGGVNWASINNWLDKGEVRAMAWHDIGHGADTVSYWQWRSALNGQEQYHGTLVGPDGTPDPLYPEIAQVGKEFEKASPALAGTSVQVRGRNSAFVRQPLGDQLAEAQQEIRSRRRDSQLLRSAAGDRAVGGHRAAYRVARPVQAGRGAGLKCADRCRRQELNPIR